MKFLATCIIIVLVSQSLAKPYFEILKQLDKSKCTENQYGALIVGNNQNADCGPEHNSPIFHARTTFEVDRHRQISAGTGIITKHCLVLCVQKGMLGNHAEQTIIANSGIVLGGHFNKAFLVTYFPPCSGGPSRDGRPDCATRISQLCTRYPSRIQIIMGSARYAGGGQFRHRQMDSKSMVDFFKEAKCHDAITERLSPLKSILEETTATASKDEDPCSKRSKRDTTGMCIM